MHIVHDVHVRSHRMRTLYLSKVSSGQFTVASVKQTDLATVDVRDVLLVAVRHCAMMPHRAAATGIPGRDQRDRDALAPADERPTSSLGGTRRSRGPNALVAR